MFQYLRLPVGWQLPSGEIFPIIPVHIYDYYVTGSINP